MAYTYNKYLPPLQSYSDRFMNDNTEISSSNSIQHQYNQSKKTRSVTFRLDSFVIDEMQREADQKEISLNVLVNQTLKRYCLWDRYETKIGMMPVPKIVLTSLIDKATTMAKDNGIQDIEHYRDVDNKTGCKNCIWLNEGLCIANEKAVQSLGDTISPGRIHEGLRY